jgi:hypothetical protein
MEPHWEFLQGQCMDCGQRAEVEACVTDDTVDGASCATCGGPMFLEIPDLTDVDGPRHVH